MCRHKKFYLDNDEKCDSCAHRENTGKLQKLKTNYRHLKRFSRYRYLIFLLVFSVIFAGLIVPFAAQFIFPFFFPENRVSGAEIWNQYVSIILGVVATILSIVSLYLGFKSEGEANRINVKTQTTLEHIKGKVNSIDENTRSTSNRSDIYNNDLRKPIKPETIKKETEK